MDDQEDPPSSNDPDSLLRAVAAAPRETPDPMPMRVGHFRILGRLGEGGMAMVYRAEDETLRRTVALKLLTITDDDEERRPRFLREARAAASVSHPNVAVVHQVGEAEGRVYIAMELVEGETLRARLLRGRLAPADVKDVAGQIARGLAAAHDKGIVHRDLKPENVMITQAGTVKLLDFGLAKGTDESGSITLVTSDPQRIMGTPGYMSPEQAMGEPLDVRSDVFSFGIVLYEMLSGARPFEGVSAGAVLVSIARNPVPELLEKATDLDDATRAVLLRCLERRLEARFANAGEIVGALAATGTAVMIPPRLRGVPAPWETKPRRRSMVPWLTLALVLVALGGILAWWMRRLAP